MFMLYRHRQRRIWTCLVFVLLATVTLVSVDLVTYVREVINGSSNMLNNRTTIFHIDTKDSENMRVKTIGDKNAHRRNIVKDVCSRFDFSEEYTERLKLSTRSYQKILFDPRHRIIYCEVPKAGCTTIKTILAKANGLNDKELEARDLSIHDIGVLHSANLSFLHEMPINDIHQVLKSEKYTKIIVARNPLDRVVSAYKNKFLAHTFSPELNRYIIRKYRNIDFDKAGYGEGAAKYSAVPLFSEFVDYITTEYPIGRPRPKILDTFDSRAFAYDGHWRQIVHACHPCFIEYDFILKLETLEHDIHSIMHLLNNDLKSSDLPKLNPSSGESDTKRYFNQLSPTLKKRLLQLYTMDTNMFGYDRTTN